ncbi:MAG: MxaK protein [Gammaproteobacteria bacterium]
MAWKKIDIAAGFLLLALLIGIFFEAWQLIRGHSINEAVGNPESIVIDNDSPPEIIFAKAWYLSQTGEVGEALRLYNSIERRVSGKDFERVKYNMGYIYLREAARYWNEQGVWAYSEVLTWSSLAQQAFREVLLENPANWDARFNLEFALRISPPPRESEKADWTGHKSSVHSIYPGIPGGGP